MSLKCAPEGPVNDIQVLVRIGAEPFPKPMMPLFIGMAYMRHSAFMKRCYLAHIYVTRLRFGELMAWSRNKITDV